MVISCKLVIKFLGAHGKACHAIKPLSRNYGKFLLSFNFSVDCHIKGGATRHVHFSEKGTSRLKISPSKKTFTIAAAFGRFKN